MSYFDYNTGNLPADAFRISPSQLSRFFDDTAQWFAEFLYNEAPAFQGSTASELGTCVHAAAAMYFDTKAIDTAAITAYINSLTNPDIDKAIIHAQWPIMAKNLINKHLVHFPGTHSELFLSHQIAPGIYAAGTIDLLDTGEDYYCDNYGLKFLQNKNLI